MKILMLVFVLGIFISDNKSHYLTIEISNLKEDYIGKDLYVGYWDTNKEDFPDPENVIIKDKFTVNSLEFDINKSLVENTYAVSLYIDMNGNGKLDKNFFGFPKEPFCFSKNFKPKMSEPDFEDCSISVEKDTKITLELID